MLFLVVFILEPLIGKDKYTEDNHIFVIIDCPAYELLDWAEKALADVKNK